MFFCNQAKLKDMGDNFKAIEIEDTSSHTTSPRLSCNTLSPENIILMLKYPVRSPAFLLALSLATSTVSILMPTAMIFRCLAFLLLVCCTCIFSPLCVTALIFYVERYYAIKINKAFYFVFSLKTSVDYLFSSSSVLLSWVLFVKPDTTIFLMHFVTSTLTTFVITTVMWMFKIVILKVLDCRFRDKNFFHNIQDMIYHEYVLQTLVGPSRLSYNSNNSSMIANLKSIKGVFANMLLLVRKRLHTICDALDNSNFADEHHVENAISMIFKNLTNNEHRDIQETDLLWVMKKEDIANVLQLFEGAPETKSISEASLQKWMVDVYNKRKLLVHVLKNSSIVIKQLNRIVLVNQLFLVALLWCLLMGFGTTKFLVYISSHLLLLVFIFGNYCKMICEGIMLAIVMHPFDIGDHCIIDNEQLVVKEMGLIDTVFLKDNNETVNCLNSVLVTKSISNLSRSSELVETFDIHVSSTNSSETIAAVKRKIDELTGSKPEIWHAENCFDLKAIDDFTHKYNLQMTHLTNFQNYKEKNHRRSELVVNLRKLFEELSIKNFTIQ